MPESNVSNKKETEQTSNQKIVERHVDKKHLLLISYEGGKVEQVIKSVRKTIKRLLPSMKFLLLVTNLVHVSVLKTQLNLSTDMM